MEPSDVLYGLLIGLAVGTAIGIVLADFWNSIRWRNINRETLDSARTHARKHLQAEAKAQFYRRLWLEEIGRLEEDHQADDTHSRKAKTLALVEKAGD